MKFILNGKDYGDRDLDLLIHYDSVTEKTELQFYREDGEVILDNENAEISVDIVINSNDDLQAIFEDGIGVMSSVFTACHAVSVIKRELENIEKKHSELCKQYLNLCGSLQNN